MSERRGKKEDSPGVPRLSESTFLYYYIIITVVLVVVDSCKQFNELKNFLFHVLTPQ